MLNRRAARWLRGGSRSGMFMTSIIEKVRHVSGTLAEGMAVIEGTSCRTHSQLWNRVDRLSNALAARGLRKGYVLMAWLPNCHEAIEAELACLQMGAIWVSVNSRFTRGEVEEIIRDCAPKILITDAEHLARLGGSLECDECGSIPTAFKHVFVTRMEAEPDNKDLKSYEHEIAGANAERPVVQIAPTDIARLRYTSGTTGRAKAAVLPHRVYLASLRNLQAELHPLGPDDRVLHAAPLTHASGAMIFPILAAGGANVIMNGFDPEQVLECIEREKITTMFIVPTILSRLTSCEGFRTRDLSSLRTIMYGGAPTAIEKLTPLIEKLGPTLVHIFGMTEAPYPITTLKREEHWVGNPKLGSIGKPSTICELKILDDSGNELGTDEVGEIWLRGENVMSGYWRDETETQKVLRDGWLASGDLGRRDADGYYWIVDRKKDVIISGGFNVYAKEVEIALCAHPDIAEAAVVGIPHADWGETVAAFVVARDCVELNSTIISEWCRTRLAHYKCPKRLELVAALPKNSSGKILKKELSR